MSEPNDVIAINDSDYGMQSLLDGVLRLHQKVRNEFIQLKTDYAELVTAGQKTRNENTCLQKQCDGLSKENKLLKEELARMRKSVLMTENRSPTCICISKLDLQGENNAGHEHLLSPECEAVCLTGQSETSLNPKLPVSVFKHSSLMPMCPSHVPKEIIFCPDTDNTTFTECFTKPKKKQELKMDCPNIVIPETVPMDDAIYDENESILVETCDKTFSKPSPIKLLEAEIIVLENQHAAGDGVAEPSHASYQKNTYAENILCPDTDYASFTEQCLESAKRESKMECNVVVPETVPVEQLPQSSEAKEPGSPVFNRFQEMKRSRRKNFSSPSLFDEEDECLIRSARKFQEDDFATPTSESVVRQKTRMMGFSVAAEKSDDEKEEVCLGDFENSKNIDHMDSLCYSSPSVISGLPEVQKTVFRPKGSGEAGKANCVSNDEMLMNNSVFMGMTINSGNVTLQNEFVGRGDSKFTDIGDTAERCQRKTSRFSLKKIQKENRAVFEKLSDSVTAIDASCTRKRKRSVDLDETFCPLKGSPREHSLCDSTHFVAPADDLRENDLYTIWNIDSLTTQNHKKFGSPVCRPSPKSKISDFDCNSKSSDFTFTQPTTTVDLKLQNVDDPFQLTKGVSINDDTGLASSKQMIESIVSIDADKEIKQPIICDTSGRKWRSPKMHLDDVCKANDLKANCAACLQCDESDDLVSGAKTVKQNLCMSKSDQLEDSFDRVPKAEKVTYAYADVVRKQNQRRQLESFACPQCVQWYQGLDLTEKEIKERLKTCRHKARFRPTATPEHYWSIEFPDTQVCKERGYLNVEHVSPSKHRRKKGLRVLFESNKERMKERKRKQQSIEQCLKFSGTNSVHDKPI